MIVELRDSLLLTEAQTASLEKRQAAFRARTDSAIAPMVAYVVKHGNKAKDKNLQKLITKTHVTMWPLMHETLLEAVGELREEQKQRLPPMIHWMMDSRTGKNTKGKGKRKR